MIEQQTLSFAPAFAGAEHQPFDLPGTGDDAVLLVHGFPGTPAEMRPLANRLHERGWRVKGILLPGFGIEIDTLAERTCEDWIGAVTTALTGLQREHHRVIVVGHSLGGALTLAASGRLAGQGGQSGTPVDRVLLSPFWKLNHVLWPLIPVITTFVKQVKPFRLAKVDLNDPNLRSKMAAMLPDVDFDDPAVQDGIRNFAIPGSLFVHLRLAGRCAESVAAQVTGRTLVLQGKNDPLVLPPLTRQFAARIGGQVTYTEIPGLHDLVSPAGAGWEAVQRETLAFAGQPTGTQTAAR